MKLKVKPRILIIGGIISLGLLLFIKYIFPTKSIPQDFNESRSKGAAIAQRILALSDNISKRLKEIAEYDKTGNTAEALIAISKQIIENRENQQEAVRLASQLEKMARSLSKIRPAKARQIATEAVGAEVALVSHLISYNDYLKQLFEILRSKFEERSVYIDGQVEGLIKKINEEVQAINDFDKRFNDALIELDKIIL